MDRVQIGGWLSGPPSTPLQAGEYRGSRIGLPEHGPGSLAGLGRRFLALCLDWVASIFIGLLVVPDVEYGTRWSPLVTLGVFAVTVTVGTWLGGQSLGHRVMRIRVLRVDGRPSGFLRALVRTVLVCLVIPAVAWDRDGRGLHDKLAGTVLVRLT